MKNWSNFDYSYFVQNAWKDQFRQDESLPSEEKSSEVTIEKLSQTIYLSEQKLNYYYWNVL